MKILDIITEGKFSKSQYAYHATDGLHLRSILKHGLVPNKSEGGWGSDDSSAVGYSMSSLPGVYFTTKQNIVRQIAEDLPYKENSPGTLIVVAKIQTRTADLDEDEMTGGFNLKENIFSSKYSRSLNRLGSEPEEYQLASNRDRVVSDHVEDLLSGSPFVTLDKRLIGNVKDLIHKYFTTLSFYIDEVADHNYNADETEIKELQNILTKKLRTLLASSGEKFKVDGVVGFSGANRIVGFFSPTTRRGWGDLGLLHTPNKVDHPTKIFNE